MEKIRMGVIGVGGRAYGIIKNCLANYSDVEICILCDPYEDKMQKAADYIEQKCGNTPVCTTDNKEISDKNIVDAAY